MKRCSKCLVLKPLSDFQRKNDRNRPNSDGYQSACKDCRRRPGQRKRHADMADRFWSYVQKAAPHECWLWTGHFFENGYGRLQFQFEHYRAHRVSYELAHGAIPEGILVCHSCDVRACVNPAHLWLGTQEENMRDAAQKDRRATGERHPQVKLSDEQVRQLRDMARLPGMTQRKLAEHFHCSHTLVWLILNHRLRT